ncbi:hypothetical protein F0562_007446 [Nyssa sinensis]|uniref:Uncharacterized protein n=1 Tax=Nyssa sinensis TaxID=561372 RepID=A0A5J5A839_9ASTE|nr:hypothetical protein F0562_007446 [Nyssa sinensis]
MATTTFNGAKTNGYALIMKTLLVLFVAFVLISGTLRANAKRIFLEDRQLLSDANPGQKAKVVANAKDLIAGNKGAENTEYGTSSEANYNGSNGRNLSEGNSEDEGPDGSSAENNNNSRERYFPCATMSSSNHCKNS